jgi:type IX secretion system PorP/SprF family membrane protein
MKSLLLVFLAILTGVAGRPKVSAQGSIHTVPFALGLSMQPALSGVYEGQWRASLVGLQRNLVLPRSQGGTGQLQQTVHAALQLERDIQAPWFKGGGGLWLDSERMPGLSIQHAQAALAYEVPLSSRVRYHRLRAGFQGGAIQYQLDPSAFSFEDQFDGQGFSRSTLQQLPRESLVRFDLAMGLLFYRIQKIRGNPEFNYYLGGSMRHVNRPEIGFFATEERQLSMLSMLQAGGVLRTRSPWELMGGFMYQYQNDRSHWLGQLAARYSIHEGQSILGQRLAQLLVGINYRPNLSATVLAGLGLQRNLRLACFYEIRTNVRDLLPNQRGGIGLVLQYLWGGSMTDEELNRHPFPDF